MSKTLYQCGSEEERIDWTIKHLKSGGMVSDVSLWLAGIDRPARLIGRVKASLKSDGLSVESNLENVKDAAGDPHALLTWRLAN